MNQSNHKLQYTRTCTCIVPPLLIRTEAFLRMPIDISFVRSSNEGGIPDEVKKWQIARIPKELVSSDLASNEEVQVKEFISALQDLEKSRRLLLKLQSEKRAQMNRLQKSLKPRASKDADDSPINDSSIRKEIRVLKSEVLPSILKELEETCVSLNNKFVKLGNLVDTSALTHATELNQLDSERKVLNAKCFGYSVSDPLFCIGGCETITIPATHFQISGEKKNGTKAKEKVVLSGIGSGISSAINSYAKQFFLNCELMTDAVSDIVHLPQTISLPPPMAHDALGCEGGCFLEQRECDMSQCKICVALADEELVEVPSYVAFALMNKNKTFHDRMLPKINLCLTRSHKSDKSCSRFAHEIEQIEIVAICVNNMHVSRALQDDIAQKIKEFYCSLLSGGGDPCHTQRSCIYFLSNTEKPAIRLRLLESSKLEANECRRICIEGYMPSQNRYVELSRVSNCTSFVSRSLKIKCGGNNSKSEGNEFVHLVHGVICQESAISWMLENNIAGIGAPDTEASTLANREGVMIPPSLVPFMSEKEQNFAGARAGTQTGTMIWLPFVRELTRGKGGKLNVEELVPEPKPVYFGNDTKRDCEERTSYHTNPKGGIAPNLSDESICNPWDFLPLYK
jgi:hypothetical protein